MAKAKALISCAVTAQLICFFVFAYANRWFSHAKDHYLYIQVRHGNAIPCMYESEIAIDAKHVVDLTTQFILYFTVKPNVYQNLIKLVFSLIRNFTDIKSH